MLVDYDYKFLFVDGGCQGRISDGEVYRNWAPIKTLKNESINLPYPISLPKYDDPQWMYGQCNEPILYVFVADDAIPLGQYCTKP